ncbi:MAG: VanZ family protein [Chloroflexi bacterium]|nr:VanZ family protein [Chloroflexota bacterium]
MSLVKKLDRAWLWAVLAIAWMGLIYWLSDRPAGEFDDAGDATSWLPFASTVAHIGLYFVLSVFVLRALVLLRPINEGLIAYSTVFVAFVYGVLAEIHQSNIEGRASEVGDVVADVFGAVLVVVFWILFKRYRSGLGR